MTNLTRRHILKSSLASVATLQIPLLTIFSSPSLGADPITSGWVFAKTVYAGLLSYQEGSNLLDFLSGRQLERTRSIAEKTNQILASQNDVLRTLRELRFVIREELETAFRNNDIRNYQARLQAYQLIQIQPDTPDRKAQLTTMRIAMDEIVSKLGTYGPEALPIYLSAAGVQVMLHRQSGMGAESIRLLSSFHQNVLTKWDKELSDAIQTSNRNIAPIIQELTPLRRYPLYIATENKENVSRGASARDITVYQIHLARLHSDTRKGEIAFRLESTPIAQYNETSVPREFRFIHEGGLYYNRSTADDIRRFPFLNGHASDWAYLHYTNNGGNIFNAIQNVPDSSARNGINVKQNGIISHYRELAIQFKEHTDRVAEITNARQSIARAIDTAKRIPIASLPQRTLTLQPA